MRVCSALIFLRGEQEATNATFVDHAVPMHHPRGPSKASSTDRAHGVFLGKIAVRPQAQKTNANQLNKNLLLSAARQCRYQARA